MVELVAKLRAKGLWVAIVTSKRGTSLNGNLEILKAAKDFDLLVTNDLTLHHKPHPEPIEYAMNQLGVSPKDCIMVGDTQYDLLAAEGAGVKSIGVTWGVEPEEQLKTSRPSYIVKTVAELEELISSLI